MVILFFTWDMEARDTLTNIDLRLEMVQFSAKIYIY